MNNKFDELAKDLTQSVTRRQAVKKFGAGVIGALLMSPGLASQSQADPRPKVCDCKHPPYFGCDPADLFCLGFCANNFCVGKGKHRG